MEKKLEELLKVHGFKHVNSLEEVKNYFVFETGSNPVSTTKKTTIIVSDNEIFNQTYLIDILNTVFTEYPENFKDKEFDLVYIDSFDIRLKAIYRQFIEEFELNNDGTEEYKREFEKHKLQPCIICIVPPEIDGLYIFKESIVPFQYPIVCIIFQAVFNLPTFDLTKEFLGKEFYGKESGIECEGKEEDFPVMEEEISSNEGEVVPVIEDKTELNEIF